MHKWTRTATSDNGTWLSGLRGFTRQQLGEGIERIESGYYEWPPTLPEFKLICLGINGMDMENQIRDMVLSKLTSHDRKRLTIEQEARIINQHRGEAIERLVHWKIEKNLDAKRLTEK